MAVGMLPGSAMPGRRGGSLGFTARVPTRPASCDTPAKTLTMTGGGKQLQNHQNSFTNLSATQHNQTLDSRTLSQALKGLNFGGRTPSPTGSDHSTPCTTPLLPPQSPNNHRTHKQVFLRPWSPEEVEVTLNSRPPRTIVNSAGSVNRAGSTPATAMQRSRTSSRNSLEGTNTLQKQSSRVFKSPPPRSTTMQRGAVGGYGKEASYVFESNAGKSALRPLYSSGAAGLPRNTISAAGRANSKKLTHELSAPKSMPPWGFPNRTQTVALVSFAQDANVEFRPYMEDGQKVVDPLLFTGRGNEDTWGFFAVYDGHGGRQEVDYCEAKLHEMVLAELQCLAPGADVGNALVAGFKKVDNKLARRGAWNSGCTATVALVHRHGTEVMLHVANVGDSRAVLVKSSSSRRVSTDHRASDSAEAQRVADEGGVVRHGRVGGLLSVSRSLGDHRLKGVGLSCLPDVCTCGLSGAQALVIASDGLWDALCDDDARQVLGGCLENATGRGGGHQAIANYLRETAAQALVDSAIARGAKDNILVLVMFF